MEVCDTVYIGYGKRGTVSWDDDFKKVSKEEESLEEAELARKQK